MWLHSLCVLVFSSCFFFKQKTAYEMRISDWSSDVCSSDLREVEVAHDVGHAGLLWLQAPDVDTEFAQFGQFRAEVGDLLALHRNAVDAQAWPTLAGRPRPAVGIVDSADPARILGQLERVRGDAARRIGEGCPAPGRTCPR